jgi:nitroreductase
MIEFIFKRRSIRRFTQDAVKPTEVKALLEAAMAAPSSNNRKPWHYVVISERPTLDRLADAHPYGAMLHEATLAIAVCADPGISPTGWIQDCSAATENILLAASALGLGSCWLGCHPHEDRKDAIRGVLEIPRDIEILSLLAIGHPGETKEPRTQFDAARVHKERW